MRRISGASLVMKGEPGWDFGLRVEIKDGGLTAGEGGQSITKKYNTVMDGVRCLTSGL